jgi:small conductance mechanosensitive channel
MKVMQDHSLVLKDPGAYVGVNTHGGSSVDLAVRCYCRTLDYWTVYFALMESGKNALDAAGIEIPFPQQVNHQV